MIYSCTSICKQPQQGVSAPGARQTERRRRRVGHGCRASWCVIPAARCGRPRDRGVLPLLQRGIWVIHAHRALTRSRAAPEKKEGLAHRQCLQGAHFLRRLLGAVCGARLGGRRTPLPAAPHPALPQPAQAAAHRRLQPAALRRHTPALRRQPHRGQRRRPPGARRRTRRRGQRGVCAVSRPARNVTRDSMELLNGDAFQKHYRTALWTAVPRVLLTRALMQLSIHSVRAGRLEAQQDPAWSRQSSYERSSHSEQLPTEQQRQF